MARDAEKITGTRTKKSRLLLGRDFFSLPLLE
jgi:hypothetical protein